MEPLTFRHRWRVTYADCTLGNHVYYGRYLDFLEAARGEFFRQLGWTLLELQRDDIAFPVTECHLRYVKPARYDDMIAIELWLSCAKGVRLNVRYRVLNGAGVTLLDGETHHACTSLEEKPRRIPDRLLTAFRPYLHVAGS